MTENKKPDKKFTAALKSVQKYWKTPPDGYFVNYKEFVLFSLGHGSNSFLSVIVSWTSIAISIPMMISYFKVSSGFVFIAGILASLLGLVRAPILSMIIDNSNSEKGKFRPFLPWTAAATVLSYTFIAYIPEDWTERSLFSFSIPSLPLLGAAASGIDVSLGSAVMFCLVQLGAFFQTLFAQCLTGMEQTISPVSQERANIAAFRGLISNIPGSIVNIILPVMAGLLFAGGGIPPMNHIELYRRVFPFCGIGGMVFVFFIYFGARERTVVNRDYVARVKFKEGAGQLFRNKYFWILVAYNIFVGIRGHINMYFWICNYAIGGKRGAFALSVCNILLNNAFIPGMLFGPLMIKKLGKRKVMFFSTVGFVAAAFFQLMSIGSPYLMLAAVFFENFFGGFGYISAVMVPDVLDYQQWKTGKRLEGFWQNFTAFVSTLFGFATGALAPLFMSFAGIGFGDNIDAALQNSLIMLRTFRSMTLLGIAASLLCILPFFFYDLTEKQHADIIRALKLRAAAQNFESGKFSAEDYASVREVAAFAEKNQNPFLLTEMQKYGCLDSILNFEAKDEAGQ